MLSNIKIGIIGTGNMGTALGAFWENAGYRVIYGLHNEQKQLEYAIDFPLRTYDSYENTVRNCEVILISVRFQFVDTVLQRIRQALAHKIVIDCTNPFIPNPNGEDGLGQSIRALKKNTSAGERLAEELKNSVLVKSFCNLSHDDLKQHAFRNPPIVMPYALTDPDSSSVIEELIKATGYLPQYLGDIRQSKRIELFGDLSIYPFTLNHYLNKL